MRITGGVAALAFLLLVFGCAYNNRRADTGAYGYGTGNGTAGSDVIPSQAGPGQTAASPTATPVTASSTSSGPPPVYSSSSSGGSTSQAQPGGWVTEADRSLMSHVRQTLDTGPMASSAPNVYVAAQNGTVTLTGTVGSEQQKQGIESMVRNTPGVVAVNDQLALASSSIPSATQSVPSQPAPPPVSPTGRDYPSQNASPVATTTTATGDIFNLHVQGLNDTDRNLAQRVLEGLRTDTQLASLLPTVNINVVNGRVVLQGLVQNQQQKQTIAAVVERAAGMSNVDDQMRVANP